MVADAITLHFPMISRPCDARSMRCANTLRRIERGGVFFYGKDAGKGRCGDDDRSTLLTNKHRVTISLVLAQFHVRHTNFNRSGE